jgi:hypothetical protein
LRKTPSHIKTKTHQQWLQTINLNKSNYFVENEKLKITLQNQKLIIAKLERDLNTKIMTIDYLTQQLGSMNTADPSRACPGCGAAGVWSLRKTPNNSKVVNNLLDFD